MTTCTVAGVLVLNMRSKMGIWESGGAWRFARELFIDRFTETVKQNSAFSKQMGFFPP